jgi:hypothetical protein
MPVTLQFRLPHNRAFLGEDIAVELEVTNRGEEIALVPDGTYIKNQTPLYRLIGPEYPVGIRFNLGGKIEGADDLLPPVEIAVPLKVQPATTKTMQFRLKQFVPLSQPGVYELTATVACEGKLLQSEPCRFELVIPLAITASFGRVEGPAADDEMWSAWLLRGSDGGVITRRMSHWADTGDYLDDASTEKVSDVGPDCLAPVCASVPLGSDDRQWLVYADGNRVFAHGKGLDHPVFVDRPSKIACVIPRPVTLTTGALEAFVLEQDRTVSLLEFYLPEEIPDDEILPAEEDEDIDDFELFRTRVPESIWSTRLPVQPQAIVAARTSGEWPSRRLIYVYEAHGGVIVRHLVLDENCLQTTEGTAFLPEVRLVGKSVPAFRIEKNDRSQVTLLVWRRAEQMDPFTVCTAELKFDASGLVCITSGTTVTPVCQTEDEPVDAAIDWYCGPDAPERCDWAVLLKSGKLVRNPGSERENPPSIRPVLPLELASLRLVTCLAVHHPDGDTAIRFV